MKFNKRLSTIFCLIALACVFLAVETSAKVAPTISSWRDLEPSKWSAKQALEWLRTTLYSSDSPVDDHHRSVVLEDFEKHQITGSDLVDWLKRGLRSDDDVIKLRMKVEDAGARQHIMEQLRHFTQKFRTSTHDQDTDTDVEFSKRRSERDKDTDTDLSSSVFGFLLAYRPISWLWKGFRWIVSPIITFFQSAGLLFVLTSLLSRHDNQSNLLDRSSVFFRQILSAFYSIFENRATVAAGDSNIRGKTGSPSMMMQAFKFLIGGPLSIIGGPFAYVLCALRVLSGVILDNMGAILPAIAGLAAAYFLLPESLWAPVSFVLFNIIGTYGVVRFLIQTYRVISSMLLSSNSTVNQKPTNIQQQQQQQQHKVQEPLKSSTEQVPSHASTESTSAGVAPTGYTVSSTTTATYPDSSSMGYSQPMQKNVEGRHDIYAPTVAAKRHTGAA